MRFPNNDANNDAVLGGEPGMAHGGKVKAWRHPWLWGLFLVVLTIMAYHPAWRAGFIWDDDVYVTGNPLLTAPDGLWRIWFSLESPSQYFPLTYTTFYLERHIWGLNPMGYHWVNFLLHAANALLVWGLLTRLRVPGAWLAAAIFALHPVQVESVALITERKNLLMTFFFLLTLWAWMRFIAAEGRRPWRFYFLALVFYALSLSAKTTACTLPVVLLLILWLEKMPIDRRRLLQVTPFVALGMGMGLVTMWWERYHMGTQGGSFVIGPLERLLIASRALWFYAGKLLWPANLTFSYPRWSISVSDPHAYVWILATVVMGVVIWRTRRRFGRSVEVAALFFAVTLAPVLGFIMLYTFLYSFVADHYQYLACVGPIALAVAGMKLGLDRVAAGKLFIQPVLGAALLLVLGALTWKQCGMFTDDRTLWQATLLRNPDSWMAHVNSGQPPGESGTSNDGAISHYRRALQINPNHWDAHISLGTALAQEGDVDGAIAQYQQALQINPDAGVAQVNLAGIVLLQRGKTGEAIGHFHRGVQIDPDDPKAIKYLAWLLATSPDAALRNGARAVELARHANALTGGENPDILHILAVALAEDGQYSEALETAQRVLQMAGTNSALGGQIQYEMKLFQQNRPFHTPE